MISEIKTCQTRSKPDSVGPAQGRHGMIICLGSLLPATSSGVYASSGEQPTLRRDGAALQRTGFTSLTGHPAWLCALTALVSPLPPLLKAVSFLWHFP